MSRTAEREPSFACARAAVAAALLGAAVPAAAGGYYGTGLFREADAEVRYDDNLGRTGNPRDRKEDFTYRLGAGIGYEALPATDSRYGIAARVAVERFGEYHDLDNIEIGAEAWYTIQPEPGLSRPWYEVWARGSRLEHRDSDQRDGGILEAGLLAGIRPTESSSARLGYVHGSRWGDGEVFDLQSHAVELDADLGFMRRGMIYGGYSFQWGEVVSTARASPALMAEAEAMAIDDVFGAGEGPGCALRRCAWKIDARTHFLSGGVQWELAGNLYLDFSTRWFRTRWGEAGRYDGLNYRAALYLRF